jgi:hypothetical protein
MSTFISLPDILSIVISVDFEVSGGGDVVPGMVI